jgi:hypothetical protein
MRSAPGNGVAHETSGTDGPTLFLLPAAPASHRAQRRASYFAHAAAMSRLPRRSRGDWIGYDQALLLAGGRLILG